MLEEQTRDKVMRRQSIYRIFIAITSIILTGYIIVSGCKEKVTYHKNQSHQNVADESIRAGEKLAAQYCQSCHLLPSPSLVSTAIWQNSVLPEMGPRLGIFEYQYKKYPNSINDAHIGRAFYPAQPLMSLEQWQNIIDYYTSLAPDTLPVPVENTVVKDGSSLFNVVTPAVKYYSPATCFIEEDTTTNTLVIADIFKKACYRFDKNLQLVDLFFNGSIITSIVFNRNSITGCNIGVFTPINAAAGSVETLGVNKQQPSKKSSTIIDTLLRPVNIASGDLNKDGKEDYVVCEFGYLKGELAWEENKDNNRFEKHLLKAVPGAVKAYISDYNHDGLPDIWVLFSQGDEGISLFINKGSGQFEEKRMLRFPPSYGSSYFELDDFNKDGHPDILYTCGDNADFSPELKPYHGIYIFMNDGNNNFKQTFFYPMNGCYKAVARDFRGNGKLDIAAIAYFADYKYHPGDGFVFLSNSGAFNYTPYSIPATNAGRWITMDVNDIDGDGKPDILLGNCSIGPSINKPVTDWKNGPPFLVLKNTMR